MKTDCEIVMTIFGGERCVATLDAIEAAALVIVAKAARVWEQAASSIPSEAPLEGQHSSINANPDAHGAGQERRS
jgi:hypothetical protein